MSIQQKSTEILNFEIYADITCSDLQKIIFSIKFYPFSMILGAFES